MGQYQLDDPAMEQQGWLKNRPQLPYLLPFLVFVGLMGPSQLGQWLGIDWQKLWFDYLPTVYTAKTFAAAILLAIFWKYYTPIRWNHWGLGILVGVLGVPLWLGAEYLLQTLGVTHTPTGKYAIYDPVQQIPNPAWRYLFYIIRVGGPTLVVPVMEELFFRDFVMRFLVRGARFQEVAVGTFRWFSLLGMSVLFAINHVQMLSGLLYGLMLGTLVIRTRSLGACIVAHGVTNLLLYSAWCIPLGDWQFM